MIVRALRLTDKLGNAVLKSLVWFSELLLLYVDHLKTTITVVGGGLFGFGVALLRVVWRFVWRVVSTVLAFIVGVIMVMVQRLFSRHEPDEGVESAVPGKRKDPAAEQERLDHMARRAEELTEAVRLVEDPLKVRNRTLSALLVFALAVVVVLLIWATSPRQTGPVLDPVPQPGQVAAQATVQDDAVVPFATQVPTATSPPESLRIGGSIAYALHDGGQDDLWVSVIGFEQPIQVTNTTADERQPAWSPDGHYLAFSSNRDGNWELYIQDVRTGEVTRLTYSLEYESSPRWSPDGQWLVYETYSASNLDIYITRIDGTQGPIRLTYDPAPDMNPLWSPEGRQIVYISMRDGNRDIYALSLDDPSETSAINLTNTVDVNEAYPALSPDGAYLAYSALVDGLEAVYVKPVANPQAVPSVIGRGRAPTWSPDGNSLIYAVEQDNRTVLIASQFGPVAVGNQAIALHAVADSPDWTSWRPATPSGTGAVAAPSLYEETISFVQDEPPYYRLILVGDVQAPQPVLSDRVNDSFIALREAVLAKTGGDYLGELEDAFWRMDRPPEPGQDALNWHMTGRSFAIDRNLIYGFPPELEIVREDIGVETMWRVYARAVVQDGQLGEPLRDLPWDFTARSGGDVEAYEQGGRLRAAVPDGYYVDLTALFADYGWLPVPADRSWRYNFGGVLFWQFVKTEDLTWEEAMLEVYSAEELAQFLVRPTAFPTPTLAPPTPTPGPTNTPTPLPPDQQ